MFLRNVKANLKKTFSPKEKLSGKDISFANSERIVVISETNMETKRLNEFVQTFLEGVAAAYSHDVYNTKFYIHGINQVTFNKFHLKLNEYGKIFTTPLNEFSLSNEDDILTKCDYAIISIYLTFNEEDKKGIIVRIQNNFK